MIAGKYGGVFCNLPDGTVCMCDYSYQHEDSDFLVGDTVILVVQRYAEEKKQMYGKILSKWLSKSEQARPFIGGGPVTFTNSKVHTHIIL